MTTDSPAARGYPIGIGGIAIESSTFSPLLSTIDDFCMLRGAMAIMNPPSWEMASCQDLRYPTPTFVRCS